MNYERARGHFALLVGAKKGAMFHLQSHSKWLKRRWFGGESTGYGFCV